MLILFGSALFSLAVDEGFARYQPIIDKHPFGEEPPDADIVQVPVNQSFAKDLRLSMIYEGPSGDIRAGIVDNSTKKSYTLKVGESANGIELIEANIANSEATLKKGNEVVLFNLKAGEQPKMVAKKPEPRASSYAERRKALLQKVEERKKAEEPKEPALTGEALQQHLQEVQMDAIRTGKPPLPMQLTPEMDAQLVSEGVLPPQ
jgi:hypothetical protein